MTSTASPKTEITVVDSIPTLLSLLNALTNLPVAPPSLYLDLEGIKLSRHGSISILSLHTPPAQKTYLIDIHRLGAPAFTTTNASGTSLKSILESPTTPKVIFDVRNDSDALFAHFHISFAGIEDLQLMELASRKGSREFVAGLAKCVEKDLALAPVAKAEWLRIKTSAAGLWDPNKGGRYEVFNERPMRDEIVRYCAGDVELLAGLFGVYSKRLSPPGEAFWRSEVKKATEERIRGSWGKGYDPQAASKVCGPWDEWYIENAIEAWNDDVLFDALHGGC